MLIGPTMTINNGALAIIYERKAAMPGPLLHLGATVMCSHLGQATPTSPNPRVLVSGQPVVPLTSMYSRGGLHVAATDRGERALRDRAVRDVGAASNMPRRAAPVDRQPSDLRPDRHTVDRDGDPASSGRDVIMTNIDFPFHFDSRGRTAATDDADHIRDLIYQVLFTAPGERVMRPGFGSGLLQFVFAPNSVVLAATTQFLVQGALQQWLGDLIVVEALTWKPKKPRCGSRCST